MKGMTRVVLVDPREESRQEVGDLLASIGSIRLADACASFEAALTSIERVRPDLVILGLDTDPAGAEAAIRAITQARPEVAILPASSSRDGELILRIIRAGAREFLPLPASVEDLAGAVERLVPVPGSAGQGASGSQSQIVAIIGPNGGIGCTSLAINLAVTLARDPSREVVLVDFDLATGDIDVCLDLIPEQSIADVARSVGRLDPTLLTRSLCRHSSGLYVLPGPTSLDEAARIDPESLRPVLELLRSVFPQVVVDLSKGLHASDLIALELADVILTIVQLEPACLRNGTRLMDLFRQLDGALMDKVRVVANRVGATSCEVSPKKAEELLKTPIHWQVVNDFKSFNAARSKGVPLEIDAPGSRAHRGIIEIARELDPEAATRDRGRSRLGRIAAAFF